MTKRLTTTPTPDTGNPTFPAPTPADIRACLAVLSRRRAAQIGRMAAMTRLRGTNY